MRTLLQSATEVLPNQTALNTYLVRCHLTLTKQVSNKPDINIFFLCFCEMHKLQDILTSANVQGIDKYPSTSKSWCLRQSVAQEERRKARSCHIKCLLSCNVLPEQNCSRCTSPASLAAKTACQKRGCVWIGTYTYTKTHPL